MKIAHKLKEYRTKNKYTQAQIAEILETTQQHYQLYESSKHPLPIEYYIKLAELYQVSIDELCGYNDYKKNNYTK